MCVEPFLVVTSSSNPVYITIYIYMCINTVDILYKSIYIYI
jgi:hypothetical protein